jgi:DNA polymerase-3 subunit beta
MTHSFKIAAADLKRMIDKTQFAISTEETRYYLNGIFLHTATAGKAETLRAVATDGHRLAQYEIRLPSGAKGMPGVIVPRKTGGRGAAPDRRQARRRSPSRCRRRKSASRSAT